MPRKPFSVEINGFNGMYNSLDGNTPDDQTLWFAENLWPIDPEHPSAIVTRPPILAAAAPSASGGSGTIQCILIAQVSGTATAYKETLFAVIAGEIWQFNGLSTNTWTRKITQAQLTAASITFDTSAAVYATPYNGAIVFTDQNNAPFAWDGTAGGGLTAMTNAPVFWGQPVVYYAKLFAIKSSDPRTIVWSEENAVNTGYTSGGYNNTWTLTQTSQAPLWALTATNSALYYWRFGSIGAIQGAVTPDFTTTGVHDTISMTVGMGSTAGGVVGQPLVVGETVYFQSADGRPYRIDGTTLTNLAASADCVLVPPGTLATSHVPYPYTPNAATTSPPAGNQFMTTTTGLVHQPSYFSGRVVFWYANGGSPVPKANSFGLVYSHTTGRCQGFFSLVGDQTNTMFAGAQITARAVYGGTSGSSLGATPQSDALWICARFDGKIGYLAMTNAYPPSSTNAVDTFMGSSVSIKTLAITRPLALSDDTQKTFDVLSVDCYNDNANASVGVLMLSSTVPSFSVKGTTVSLTPTTQTRQKKDAGLEIYGRWGSVVLTGVYSGAGSDGYGTAAGRLQVFGLKITGFVDAADSGMP